jgi:hypothetical protein
MNGNLYSFIKIDLRLYPKLKDLKKLLEDNGISEKNISSKKLHENRYLVDVFIFDPITFLTVAYLPKSSKDYVVVKDLLSALKDLKSLAFTVEVKPLSLDSILEKISSSGMNSLTNEEKQFLDLQSKK